MFLKYLKLLPLFYVIIPIDSTKFLVENPGFDSPAAWSSGAVPCGLETVVFPENYPAILPLPQDVDISGMILPIDGAILLPTSGKINLANGASKKQNCRNGKSRKANLKKPEVRKWFNPATWRDINDLPNAKTASEKIPCLNETIFIEGLGPFSLDMDNVAVLRLGALTVKGSFLSKGYLENFLNTNLGQILFQNTLGIRVEYYKSKKCGCQRELSDVMEPLCRNIANNCPRPHCLVPIRPLGECCDVCGALLQINTTFCSRNLLSQMQNIVEKSLEAKGLTNDLNYHIDYFSLERSRFAQLYVVDKEDYDGKSVKFVQNLQESKDWQELLKNASNFRVFYAGKPYNPNFTFGSFLLIVLCLLFVSFIILFIFAHSCPDNRYVRQLPSWLYDTRIWQNFFRRSHFVFARFENFGITSAAGDDNQVNLQHNIVMGYDAENDQVRERAFDNPMFGEARAKSYGEPSGTKKDSNIKIKKVDPVKVPVPEKLESGTINVDNSDVEDEQELTEIHLDEISDNSDVEQKV